MNLRFALYSTVAALSLAGMTGCTTLPDGSNVWSSAKGISGSEIRFTKGGEEIVGFSNYRNFRVLSRTQYKKHHVPRGVHSVYIGDEHGTNFDVFYAERKDGEWYVYSYSHGKFDIDFPPTLVGTASVR